MRGRIGIGQVTIHLWNANPVGPVGKGLGRLIARLPGHGRKINRVTIETRWSPRFQPPDFETEIPHAIGKVLSRNFAGPSGRKMIQTYMD